MILPEVSSSEEERLARHFADIYAYLLESHVPRERLPSPWHLLSRVVKCLDPSLLHEWMEAYIGLEAEVPDSGAVPAISSGPSTPAPKYRPRYLKALDHATGPETPGDHEAT